MLGITLAHQYVNASCRSRGPRVPTTSNSESVVSAIHCLQVSVLNVGEPIVRAIDAERIRGKVLKDVAVSFNNKLKDHSASLGGLEDVVVAFDVKSVDLDVVTSPLDLVIVSHDGNSLRFLADDDHSVVTLVLDVGLLIS